MDYGSAVFRLNVILKQPLVKTSNQTFSLMILASKVWFVSVGWGSLKAQSGLIEQCLE